jgi:transposase
MGAPYSEDLRERVLNAIDEGMSKEGMSKMQAHRTFHVSRSTIDDWLALRAQTGGVAANTTYQRGPEPALPDTPEVRAFIAQHQHSTLAQMAQAWEKEQGTRLSRMTFATTLLPPLYCHHSTAFGLHA